MKKLFSLILILVVNTTFGQVSNIDWKQYSKSKTLKSYVEKQAYEYLKFKEKNKDSVSKKKVTISHKKNDTKIIVRDLTTIKKPLIIINQYPLEKLNVLEHITLEHVEKINLNKPTDKLCDYYGSRGKYGLIIITMNKRKWKKLKRKYCSNY